MKRRVLIADDEPVARRRLRRLLRAHPDVEICAECGDGAEAVDAIRTASPDLVLLDIQMPELDGFAVLQALPVEEIPAVIFVTAYDQYALRAFEVHALDYLLKPVEAQRLAIALQRARERLARPGVPEVEERLRSLVAGLAAERRYLTRIPVRVDGRLIVVDLDDVAWIGAADNYVALHVGSREYLLRDTMDRLERELDPASFVRIHRSAIVRIDRVHELIPDFHGDMTVVLKDGVRVPLSRGYKSRVAATTGWKL